MKLTHFQLCSMKINESNIHFRCRMRMIAPAWRVWEIEARQKWPLRNKIKELHKTLKKIKASTSVLQSAHSQLKNKETQQRGKILELTVKRRDLITRYTAEKKQLEVKAEELAAAARMDVHNQHRNEKKEWDRQSRAWSAERNRLKREIDQCAAAVARISAEKSNAIRDVEVALSKQRRIAGKARKFRDVARKVQEAADIHAQTRSEDLEKLLSEFQMWKNTTEKRMKVLKKDLSIAILKERETQHKVDSLRKAEVDRKFRFAARQARLHNHMCMYRCFAYWMKMCEGQRIGARIAMRSQQHLQRETMRAAYAKAQSDKKAKSAQQALKTLQDKLDLEHKNHVAEVTRLNEELDLQIKTFVVERDALTEAKLEATAASERRDAEACAEIRALMNEVKDLRESVVVSDANKLTAMVLEEEVTSLREKLEVAQAEVAQKKAELNAVSHGINSLLLTPDDKDQVYL